MPLVIRFGIFFIFFLCHHLTLIASEDSLFCPDRNITIEIPGPESTGNYFLFGKVSKKRLHLGFQSIDLAETSVTLSSSTNSIEMAKNKFVSPAVFLVKNSNPLLSDKVTWKLQILDASLNVADTLNGRGKLPEKIIWAKPGSDARVVWNKSYFYFLKVSRIDGSFSFSTRPRPFIIFAVTTLKHRISTSALSSYKKIYEDTRFQAFLGKLAVTINKYKEKKWNLVAYMKKDQPLLCDNVFRLRNYLVTKHRIPIKRFHTFCDFVEGVVPDENYVSLVGTRPKKDVSLARFKERKSHDVETGGEDLTSSQTNPS